MEFSLEKCSAFDFSNTLRNEALVRMGMKSPAFRNTGTTIVGVVYKDGVVLGGDTRSTAGSIIASKDALKVHKLTDLIYACGAGTAADLDQVTKMLSAQLKLLELNTGKKARVITALRHAKQYLFKYMGYVGAYLIIGGIDFTGPHLYYCSSGGATMSFPYVATGSGSYAAISRLELGYKNDMTVDEAIELVKIALMAGMHGDNFSGNSLRYCVVNADGASLHGPYYPDFTQRSEPCDLDYKFEIGSTTVLKEKKSVRAAPMEIG